KLWKVSRMGGQRRIRDNQYIHALGHS
ncbi:MAG: hypothetical protein QOC67_3922, partial [Pseudonocardiales bacterium]|nr:hypothetical protein [Pseudonocardiales bacterium]